MTKDWTVGMMMLLGVTAMFMGLLVWTNIMIFRLIEHSQQEQQYGIEKLLRQQERQEQLRDERTRWVDRELRFGWLRDVR